MNDSLIKQLELAIQVEKGEIPWSEIQYRPLSEPPEFGWICVAPCGKPSWNFTNAEYRRKPKPLERWVNQFDGGQLSGCFFKCLGEAECAQDMHNRAVAESGLGLKMVRIIHMKEVL